MIAYVDLDGTLADFDGAMRRDFLATITDASRDVEYLPPDYYDEAERLPHMKRRIDLIKQSPDWWFDLEPIEAGFNVMRYLKEAGFKIHILTRASKRFPMCWEQKVRWCNRHLTPTLGNSWGITITTDKSNLRGDVLVDDWPGYVKPWVDENPNGLVLMPVRKWNTSFDNAAVVRYGDGFGCVIEQHVVNAILSKKVGALR